MGLHFHCGLHVPCPYKNCNGSINLSINQSIDLSNHSHNMVEITNRIGHYAGIFWMPLAVKKDPWVVPHWIPEMSRNKFFWIVFLDPPSKLVVQACMFIWSHMELHMELHMACYSCKNIVMSSHQMATYYSYILLCTYKYIYICIYVCMHACMHVCMYVCYHHF